MITFEVFLLGLLIVSAFTSLVCEAAKKILTEYDVKYGTNTLAAIISAVLSTGVGVGYVLMAGITFTVQVIVCIIALIFLSWLCAMVGYDKVIQTIASVNKPKEE